MDALLTCPINSPWFHLLFTQIFLNTSSLPILHTQHHHHGSRLSPHQLPGLCQVAARHPAIHAQTSRRILQLSPGIETQGYPGVPQAGELQHARTPITFIIQILILFSRYYSANYAVVVALLAVYSLISNPLLLLSLGFLIGGFLAISRFGTSSFQIVVSSAAGFACSSLGTDYQLTIYWQSRSPSRSPAKSSPLGTSTSLSSSSVSVLGLFPNLHADRRTGLPLLWFAAPLSTFFWLVGSSGCLVGAHAGLMEPGVES